MDYFEFLGAKPTSLYINLQTPAIDAQPLSRRKRHLRNGPGTFPDIAQVMVPIPICASGYKHFLLHLVRTTEGYRSDSTDIHLSPNAERVMSTAKR